MSHLFGSVRQNGFVVVDVDEAVHHWTCTVGVGPFFVAERLRIDDFVYRGEPVAIELKIALANSGPLQIELIQVLSAGPSDYREFLKKCGEGLHHVAFWTADFDLERRKAQDLGYSELHSGSTVNGDRFVYFDTRGHPGSVIELSEIGGVKGRVFEMIADSAVGWDGSEAVRSISEVIEAAVHESRAANKGAV